MVIFPYKDMGVLNVTKWDILLYEHGPRHLYLNPWWVTIFKIFRIFFIVLGQIYPWLGHVHGKSYQMKNNNVPVNIVNNDGCLLERYLKDPPWCYGCLTKTWVSQRSPIRKPLYLSIVPAIYVYIKPWWVTISNPLGTSSILLGLLY